MKRAAQLFGIICLAWLVSAQAYAQDPTQTPAQQPQTQTPTPAQQPAVPKPTDPAPAQPQVPAPTQQPTVTQPQDPTQAQPPAQPQAEVPAQVPPQAEPQPAAPATKPSRWSSWSDRVFLNANFATQRRSGVELTTSSTFTLYGETGSTTAVQSIPADGTMIDVMLGARIYGNLGAAIGYSAVSKEGDGALSSLVPHPLYYDTPRRANATVEGLNHREKAVHTVLVYMVPIGKGFEAMVSGGLSFFNLEQDTLGAMTFGTETSPYTSIAGTNATMYTTKTNKKALNVGLDLTWRIMKNVGIGAFIRHAGTSVDFTTEGGDDLTVDVGGLQGGAGIRIRF
jgi:hypothetical protein